MITLNNLTARQVQLCNLLWACETEEDLFELTLAIPAAERPMLATLQEMMIQESAEEELSLMERYPEAEAMLEILKKDFL